jgi:hypothetical protein
MNFWPKTNMIGFKSELILQWWMFVGGSTTEMTDT